MNDQFFDHWILKNNSFFPGWILFITWWGKALLSSLTLCSPHLIWISDNLSLMSYSPPFLKEVNIAEHDYRFEPWSFCLRSIEFVGHCKDLVWSNECCTSNVSLLTTNDPEKRLSKWPWLFAQKDSDSDLKMTHMCGNSPGWASYWAAVKLLSVPVNLKTPEAFLPHWLKSSLSTGGSLTIS